MQTHLDEIVEMFKTEKDSNPSNKPTNAELKIMFESSKSLLNETHE